MGTYAFSATAYGSSGEAITTICLDVALPREQSVTLVLPGPQDCEPVRSPGGAHAGDPAPTGGGVPTVDASVPTTANGWPCGVPCQGTVYSSPTKDISLPKQCWAPGEFMPVTIHIPVTAMDWLWVKNHPDYGGNDREFWDKTGVTTGGAIYRGGEREPTGLHAPTTSGSFSITWHPNDGGDKDVHSRLDFAVRSDCP